MNASSESGSIEPIRLLEHNLIDICDVLDATFSLDGAQVAFVHRAGGMRREWRGQLGDWLVGDGELSWRIVPDAEFGAAAAEADGRRREPVAMPSTAKPAVRPSALTS